MFSFNDEKINDYNEENNPWKSRLKIVKRIFAVVTVIALATIGIVLANKAAENHVCSYCNNEAPKENEPISTYIWEEVSNTATCNEGGNGIYACKKCKKEYSIITEALGHDYKVTSDTATCASAGTKTLSCSRCRQTKTEISPRNDNHRLESSVYKYENGYQYKKCKVCGKLIGEKLNTSVTEFGTSVSTSNIYFFYCTGAAKNYVSNNLLKYPASSSFQTESQMKVYVSGSNYTCIGYVDAANGFGAKERKYFRVTMKITVYGDKYSYAVSDYEIY